MPNIPPPPPPPVAPPQSVSVPHNNSSSPNRKAMLSDIRGGISLKKTVTNDRSQPILATNSARPQHQSTSLSSQNTLQSMNSNGSSNFMNDLKNGVSNLKPVHQQSAIANRSSPSVPKFTKPAPNTYNKGQAAPPPPPPPPSETKPSMNDNSSTASPVLRPSIRTNSANSSYQNGIVKPKSHTHKQTPAPLPPPASSKPNTSPRPPPPPPPSRNKPQLPDSHMNGSISSQSQAPSNIRWSSSQEASRRDSSTSSVDGRSPRLSMGGSPQPPTYSRPISLTGSTVTNRPLPPPPPPGEVNKHSTPRSNRSAVSQSIQDFLNHNQPAVPYRDKSSNIPGSQMPWTARTMSVESDDPPPPPPSRKFPAMSTSCYNLSMAMQPGQSPAPPVPPKRPVSVAPPSPSRLSMMNATNFGAPDAVDRGVMQYDTMLEEKFRNRFPPESEFPRPPAYRNVCSYYPSKVREIPQSGPPVLPQRK